jgi:hypothetical protein
MENILQDESIMRRKFPIDYLPVTRIDSLERAVEI